MHDIAKLWKLTELTSAHVLDQLDGFGLIGGLTLQTKVGTGLVVTGRAATVVCRSGDNQGVKAALTAAVPGSTLIVTGAEAMQTAMMGELLYRAVVDAGIGCMIIDGAIRDSAAIAAGPIPVYARGITPRRPESRGPYLLGVPVAIGGTPILPGDVIVADEEGVVRIPAAAAEAVIRQASAEVRAEFDQEDMG